MIRKKTGANKTISSFCFTEVGKPAISPLSFAGHGHGGRGTAELAGFVGRNLHGIGDLPQGLNIKSHLFETAI